EKRFYGDNVDEVLGLLASVERESDHPLAKAVLHYIGDTQFSPVEKTEVIKDDGIVATVNGYRIAEGNEALIKRKNVGLTEQIRAHVTRDEENAKSLVLTAVDGKLQVLMGIRDQIRPGLKEDLQRLKRLGVKNLVVLSGDNQGTVDMIANELGLTEAYGYML